MVVAQTVQLDAGDEFSRLQGFFLSEKQRSADLLQIAYTKNRPYKMRFASALVQADRDSRAQLETAVGSLGPEACLLYVDCYRADETPLPVRSALSVDPSGPSSSSQPLAASSSGSHGSQLVHQSFCVPTTCASATVPRKLLQSEQKFGALFRLPTPGGDTFRHSGRSICELVAVSAAHHGRELEDGRRQDMCHLGGSNRFSVQDQARRAGAGGQQRSQREGCSAGPDLQGSVLDTVAIPLPGAHDCNRHQEMYEFGKHHGVRTSPFGARGQLRNRDPHIQGGARGGHSRAPRHPLRPTAP